MTEQTTQSLLSKLAHLERKTGQNISYQFFPPFKGVITDYVSVQKAAKQIAEFIGLNEFTFVVGMTKQKDNVGGHIDLERGSKDVFIEIASDAVEVDPILWTTNRRI